MFQDKDILARKTPFEFTTSAQLGKIRPGFSSICLMLNIEYFWFWLSAGAVGKAKQKFDIQHMSGHYSIMKESLLSLRNHWYWCDFKKTWSHCV